jgi:hypothetical protein
MKRYVLQVLLPSNPVDTVGAGDDEPPEQSPDPLSGYHYNITQLITHKYSRIQPRIQSLLNLSISKLKDGKMRYKNQPQMGIVIQTDHGTNLSDILAGHNLAFSRKEGVEFSKNLDSKYFQRERNDFH